MRNGHFLFLNHYRSHTLLVGNLPVCFYNYFFCGFHARPFRFWINTARYSDPDRISQYQNGHTAHRPDRVGHDRLSADSASEAPCMGKNHLFPDRYVARHPLGGIFSQKGGQEYGSTLTRQSPHRLFGLQSDFQDISKRNAQKVGLFFGVPWGVPEWRLQRFRTCGNFVYFPAGLVQGPDEGSYPGDVHCLRCDCCFILCPERDNNTTGPQILRCFSSCAFLWHLRWISLLW